MPYCNVLCCCRLYRLFLSVRCCTVLMIVQLYVVSLSAADHAVYHSCGSSNEVTENYLFVSVFV